MQLVLPTLILAATAGGTAALAAGCLAMVWRGPGVSARIEAGLCGTIAAGVTVALVIVLKAMP